MRRRRFIALAGVSALAGCGEETTDDDGDGGGGDGGDGSDGSDATPTATATDSPTPTAEPTPTEEPTPSPTPTATPTPVPDPDVQLSGGELVTVEGEYRTDYYGAAEVTNAGTGWAGELTVEASWYNSDDEYLGKDSTRLTTLGPGETWAARVWALDPDGEPARAEVELLDPTGAPPTAPDGVAVEDSEVSVGDMGITATGRIHNGTDAEIGYLESIVQLQAGDGTLLADGWTNVTDLPADETWQFETSLSSRDRDGQVADHRVFADTEI
jgi:hypothetical protein